MRRAKRTTWRCRFTSKHFCFAICSPPSCSKVAGEWDRRAGPEGTLYSRDGVRAGKVMWEQMVAGKRATPWLGWHGYREVDVLTSCVNCRMFQNSTLWLVASNFTHLLSWHCFFDYSFSKTFLSLLYNLSKIFFICVE